MITEFDKHISPNYFRVQFTSVIWYSILDKQGRRIPLLYNTPCGYPLVNRMNYTRMSKSSLPDWKFGRTFLRFHKTYINQYNIWLNTSEINHTSTRISLKVVSEQLYTELSYIYLPYRSRWQDTIDYITSIMMLNG